MNCNACFSARGFLNICHKYFYPDNATRGALNQHLVQQQALLEAYLTDVESGSLKKEDRQEHCVRHFDTLLTQLAPYTAAVQRYNQEDALYDQKRRELLQQILAEENEAQQKAKELKKRGGWLPRVFDWFKEPPEPPYKLRQRQALEREERLVAELGPGPDAPNPPQGLYIYGSVGSGKTMLMDRFFKAVSEMGAVPLRKRVHFNAALLEVHSLMHAHEQAVRDSIEVEDEMEGLRRAKRAKLAVRRFLRQRLKQSDVEVAGKLAASNAAVFPKVAASIMGQDSSDDGAEPGKMRAGVLCFDEININDPFTAIALKGVFEALMDSGVIIVATSNRAPWDLNNYGVHEAIFNHFKERLLEACTPVCLETADFRMAGTDVSAESSYLWPLSWENQSKFEELWQAEVEAEGGQASGTQEIPVLFGRTLEVRRSAGSVARFTFAELCDAPRGSADYCAVAAHFHTVFLDSIPIMSLQNRNLARRFILLLDELYNARTRFFCTAACPPGELFAGTADDQPVVDLDQLEQLQFESAAEGSRLRRDVMEEGGVAPLFQAGTATVTTTHLGGLEEKFAFARAVSRLHEMSRNSALPQH